MRAGAGREPGAGREMAGRSREPRSEPEGRGTGWWPLPRRPLEGRREGGAPPPPTQRAPVALTNQRGQGAG